jgi:hypothetical protein
MINFILLNLKSIFNALSGLFALFILDKNNKLSNQNDNLKETVKIKNKVINVLRSAKNTDLNGNIKRMRNKKL